MSTQDVVEAWRNEAIEQGVRKGLATAVLVAYEARFGSLPADARATLGLTDDEARLRRWVKLASTGSADDVVAALRAYGAR